MSKGEQAYIKKYVVLGYFPFIDLYLNRFYFRLHSNYFQSH